MTYQATNEANYDQFEIFSPLPGGSGEEEEGVLWVYMVWLTLVVLSACLKCVQNSPSTSPSARVAVRTYICPYAA